MRLLCRLIVPVSVILGFAFGADRPVGIDSVQIESAPLFRGATDGESRIRRLGPIAPSEAGAFLTAEDGTRYLTLRFANDRTSAVRLHLQKLHLPAGAKLFVYGYENGAVTGVAGPYTGSGPTGEDSLWTAAVRGKEAVLE